MTSEIDKLKHFHIEDYSGIYFTDELNAVVPLLGKLILFKNYVIGILLVLFDLLMKNGCK